MSLVLNGFTFYLFIYCSYSLEPGGYRKEIEWVPCTSREVVGYSNTSGTRTPRRYVYASWTSVAWRE